MHIRNTKIRTGIAAVLACCLFLTGCFSMPGGGGSSARTTESTYYNGYLGLTVNLPAGLFLANFNDVNLTETPEQSMDMYTMDRSAYGDGGYYLDMLSVQNRPESNHDDHAMIHFYAEDYQAVFDTLDEYVDACEDVYTGDRDDDYTGVLTNRTTTRMQGVDFVKLTIEVDHPENDAVYIEEHYITQIRDLFFVVYVNYWSDSATSKKEAQDMLDIFTINQNAIIQDDTTDATYTNGYLGLTVVIPENQYVKSVNGRNLRANPADTALLNDLERVDYGDGGYYIDLMELQSKPTAGDSDHAELDLYAEGYSSFGSLDAYVDACEEVFTGDMNDGYYGELISREAVSVNRVDYIRLTIQVTNPDNSVPYMEEHYITQIKDLYFVAYVNYWSDSDKSYQDAMDMLNNTFYFSSADNWI